MVAVLFAVAVGTLAGVLVSWLLRNPPTGPQRDLCDCQQHQVPNFEKPLGYDAYDCGDETVIQPVRRTAKCDGRCPNVREKRR